jgi:hypothetical protein
VISNITLDSSSKPLHTICLVFVFILTTAVYWPGLNGPLLLDDFPNLYHLHKFGEGSITWKQVFEMAPHGIDRSISTLSFIGNWLLTGEGIWALKFTNLIIHLLCGLLIYRLSWSLLHYDLIDNELRARNIALLIVALWLLSPFLLSTVLYVIQRMAQLSALFTLCGLLIYVVGRINYGRNNSPGISLIAISLAVFWPLATFSKQNGILLPLLLLIIEFFFFYKDTSDIRIIILRIMLALLVCIPGLIVVGMYLYPYESLLESYLGRDFTLYERLITQPRVLLDYIGNLLLIPGTSPMSLFHDDYLKSLNLFNPITTLLSLVVFLLILTGAYITFGGKTGIIFFGLIFYYAAHIIESTFLPLELYFEHRNYLPAFGIYFSAVTGIYLLVSKTKSPNITIALFIIIPISFSILTYQRSLVWEKMTNIFYLAEITHPESPRVNEGMAYLNLLSKDSDRALHYLERAAALKPEIKQQAEFYFKYLLAYCYGNMAIHESAVKLDPRSLSNELSTIKYFQMFVDAVEAKQCDTLNLDIITEQITVAIAHKNHKYDQGNISSANTLLIRLLNYIKHN